MIKTIIFDVDNTILKFSQIAAKCFQQTARELNLKYYSKRKISRWFGTPSKKFIPVLWPQADVNKFHALTLKKIKAKKVRPIPKAVKTLEFLSKIYPLALLSSKPRILMSFHLKQIHLSRKLFQFIYSAEDVKYPKPSPKVFSKPLKNLKLKKTEVLYVGDSIFDCIAAKKAKLNFVAVLTGSYSKKDFQKYKVKNRNILKSLKDLPKWLKKYDRLHFL